MFILATKSPMIWNQTSKQITLAKIRPEQSPVNPWAIKSVTKFGLRCHLEFKKDALKDTV